MKTNSEKDIRALFKQQNYKYASLKTTDGKSIVTYNTENNPKVKASHKVDEAFERLKVLPDGVYMFCFANSKGRNVAPDEFAFMKGNVAVDEQGKGYPFQVMQHLPVKANEYEKILSYPEVMKLQLELTTTQFKLSATEAELAKANIEIVSLNAEVSALEAKGLSDSDPNSPGKWVEMAATTLIPMYDRYMLSRERELALAERGITLNRGEGVRPKPKPKPKPKQQQLPVIGSEDWNKWMDALENATDEDYQFTLNKVKGISHEHYQAINDELESEEEEEEEQQNEKI